MEEKQNRDVKNDIEENGNTIINKEEKKIKKVRGFHWIVYPLIWTAITFIFSLIMLDNSIAFAWMLVFIILPIYVIGIIVSFAKGLIIDFSDNNKYGAKKQCEIVSYPVNKSYIVALKICKIFSSINIIMGSISLGSCIIGMFASGSIKIFCTVLNSLGFFVITIVSYLGIKKQKIYGAIGGIISYLFNFLIFFYWNRLLYVVLLLINVISSIVVIVYLHKTKNK